VAIVPAPTIPTRMKASCKLEASVSSLQML
jgi:hypothetical protein